MTEEQVNKIKEFTRNWLTKVVAKRKDYLSRLLDAADSFFYYNEHTLQHVIDWDNADGKHYCMNTLCNDFMEDHGCLYTQKVFNDVICAIRIGVDLYIKQSGGVTGYTVGDLCKAFDGTVPPEIAYTFIDNEGNTIPDINLIDKNEYIWL
jgi:hypothetical protein